MTSEAIRLDNDGWLGSLRLGFRLAGTKTVLAERRRHGPLAVQRPFYPEDGTCHTYLLHPPGGIVAGDGLDVHVGIDTGAAALVTTPGAGKYYRSAGGKAHVLQRLQVAESASLEWLPLENIYFPGARVRTDTRVMLAANARIAYAELHCLGRPAIDEVFDSGELDLRLDVYRAGLPLLRERQRVDGRSRLRPALLAGRPVSGLLLLGPGDDKALELCRVEIDKACIDKARDADHFAATLLEDLIAVRYLGGSTERARTVFEAIWQRLRPDIMGRPACRPRIWAT